MKDPFGLSRAIVPAAYSQLLLEVVHSRGLSLDEVFRCGRLPARLVMATDTRLTTRQWSRLVLAALELSQDPGLGCEYGLRTRLTVHGVMGYALLSAPTLGSAFALLSRFFTMRVRNYDLQLVEEGEWAVLTLTERHPVVGLPPDQALALRRFLHESVLLGMVTCVRSLLGRGLSEPELSVTWPRPDYHAHYQDRLPAMRFNQPATQLRFRASDLAAPLVMADPIAYQQALAQCEQERLRFVDEADDIVTRVRAILVLQPGVGYPSLTEVADALRLSERTLKRRLQEQGVAFQGLLNDVRQAEAAHLLGTTNKSVQEIADWLGYATPTNFVRAFRLWHGMTPNQYREHAAGSQGAGDKIPIKPQASGRSS
jgi:AraC-like DNA-binding protein